MECHDVQQLLAFVNRPSEELDAPECHALRDHLEKCPDCAARLQADRRADETFGPLMRDVLVPSDLKQKVLKRLHAERPRSPWKWIAAAAVVLVALGATAWLYRPLPEFTLDDVNLIRAVDQLDEDSLEDRFDKQNMSIKVPREMDYQFLQHAHVVEVNGRRAAKLSFSRTDRSAAVAEVLILSQEQFRLSDLRENQEHRGTTSIRIWRENDRPGFVYVAYFRGNINFLTRNFN